MAILNTALSPSWSDTSRLFGDAPIYYRATEVWVHGGDPWSVRSPLGIPFGAPPPALLLNLPLLPFGEWVARPFWAIAGLLGWLLTMRSLRLPPWWVLFPPFVEGWLAASPDPALAGLAVIGGGALSAVAKPYGVPGMLSDGRWRAATLGVGLGAVTLPLLPWATYLHEFSSIEASMRPWQQNLSAWGDPLSMAAVAIALALLGRRLALGLAVPGLFPGAQLHYSIFSVGVGASSAIIAMLLALPHVAPVGIVGCAVVVRVLPWVLDRAGKWDTGRVRAAISGAGL